MRKTWTGMGIKLAGLLALGAVGLLGCDGDNTSDTDRFSPERAILIGDVEGTAERNEGEGSVDTNVLGQLTLSTTTINFEQADVGTGRSNEKLRVANTGDGNLRIRSLRLVENDADDDREILPVGETTLKYFTALRDGKTIYIAPDESIELEFEWRPINTVADQGTLTIGNDDPANADKRVTLDTPTLAPQLSTEPRVIFPRVAAGMRGTQITSLLNSGESPLQIKDIVLSPVSNRDFKLTFPDPEDIEDEARDASSWKSTLAPGESIPMRVVFEPDSDAPSKASVFITSNDPNLAQAEIKLEGNAGTPCIKLGGVVAEEDASSPLTHRMDFGLSALGRETAKTITIENCSRTEPLNISRIEITDNGGGDTGYYALIEDSIPEGLGTEEGIVIDPLQSLPFKVGYSPDEEIVNTGELVIENNDVVNSQLTVGLSGKGTNNACPLAVADAAVVGSTRYATEVSTIPLKNIQFRSSSSDSDGSVQRHEWNIVSAPPDSGSRLTPSNRVPDPNLFIDVAGEYIVELVVYDSLGLQSCEESRVTIIAEPDEAIHVQLSWDTPGDPDQLDSFGTDLDLHYMRPGGTWNDRNYDIFWQNVTADWGSTNDPTDDPSLDIDDTDGKGPENINHDNPRSGASYSVGVYYYDDNGFGVSYATVRIYIEGSLKFERRDKYMQKERTFWDVATIVWPSKQIFARDQISQNFPR